MRGVWLVCGLLVACTLDSSGSGQGGGDADTNEDTTADATGTASQTDSTVSVSGTDAGATTDAVDPTMAGSSATSSATSSAATDSSSGSATTGDPSTTGRPACANAEVLWEADFSEDPTNLDDNGLPGPDWRMRDGSDFPVSDLVGGVWQADDSPALDTSPLHDFDGVTVFEARMRATEVGGEGSRGATMWINAGWGDGTISVLYARLELQEDDTQRLRVVTKTDNASPVELEQVTGLPNDFVDIAFEIDVDAGQALVWLNGAVLDSYAVPSFPPIGNERWASLYAWDIEAEFDHVSVFNCL